MKLGRNDRETASRFADILANDRLRHLLCRGAQQELLGMSLSPRELVWCGDCEACWTSRRRANFIWDLLCQATQEHLRASGIIGA